MASRWPAPGSAPHPRRTPRSRNCSAVRWCRCGWSTRASITWTPRSRCSTSKPWPTPGGFQLGQPPGVAQAVPGRAAGRRARRRRAGAQRGVRRPACGARRAGHRAGGAAARARLPVDPRRPVRAAQGRRRGEVLHLGDPGMSLLADASSPGVADHLRLTDTHTAHNYAPLPVVIAAAEGAWVTDVAGSRYLDCLSAYSAVNFGHRNERVVAAARAQLDRVTLTSRAFGHDQLGPFCAELAELSASI